MQSKKYMLTFRKRFLFWVIKEYIKRWKKSIALFFILGIGSFFLLRFLLEIYLPKIPIGEKETIGIAGAYTVNTLPSFVLSNISSGLTYLDANGIPRPNMAESWEIKDNGKTYIFHLKKKITFTDNITLSSDKVTYSFSDSTIERPDSQTVIFKLKESYAPFLTKVSDPFFKKGFIGVGEYKVKKIEQNGNFVSSLILASRYNDIKIKTYKLFYPTEDALKLAFVLGEITKAQGLSNSSFHDINFSAFPHVTVSKNINYSRLVTLFYNTQDPVLSDKRLRQALSYALPDSFEDAKRSYVPFSQTSWAYQESVNEPRFDIAHAKILLGASSSASQSAQLTLVIKSYPKYKKTADTIAAAWKKIGINSKIEFVDSVPSKFQIFLGYFQVPPDPDQYMLWHSKGDSNITRLNNQRIDKLLEEGRTNINLAERKKTYADFIKYLLDEAPASFLYFPITFDVTRK